MKSRREVLEGSAHACLGAIAMAAMGTSEAHAQPGEAKPAAQKFLLVGLCGSENPTRANFPFVWAAALKEAGHEVRIELAGDGTVMMRTPVANSVTAVGWASVQPGTGQGDRAQDSDICVKSLRNRPWGG